MQRRIIKINVGNQERNAIEADFEIVGEHWNEYRLLDGGRIRMKTSALRIFRLVDDQGNPTSNREGDPEFVVRHNTQVVGME